MGSGHIYQIHCRVLQQGGIGTIGFFYAPLGGKGIGLLLGAGSDGVAAQSLQSVKGDGGLLCNPAGPHNPHLKIFVLHNRQVISSF